MSQKKQRAYAAEMKQRFLEDCEHFGIPPTRCQDVWIAPYFARERRRAFFETKKNLATALEAQKLAHAKNASNS